MQNRGQDVKYWEGRREGIPENFLCSLGGDEQTDCRANITRPRGLLGQLSV